MGIEEHVFAALTANPAVAALVSQRIYPLVMPQNPTLPAIRYEVTGQASEWALTGAEAMRETMFDVDCWAAETSGKSAYAAAKEVQEAVRAALDAYSASGIQGVFVDNSADYYDPETGAVCAVLTVTVVAS